MFNVLRRTLFLSSFLITASYTYHSTLAQDSPLVSVFSGSIPGETNWQKYQESNNDQDLWEAVVAGHPIAMEKALIWRKFDDQKEELNQEITYLAENGNKAAQALLIDSYILDRPGFKVTYSNYHTIFDYLGDFSIKNPLVHQLLQELPSRAEHGNQVAQVLLMGAYLMNCPGFAISQRNHKSLLKNLTSYAVNNPLIRPLLIESYKNGYFGIDAYKIKTAKTGKRLALEYINSPGIADLLIAAMKEGKLNFKSKRSYKHHFKDKKTGRWRTVENNPVLPIIEMLAKNNKSAQTFLLECYIDNKYGADPLNRPQFRSILEELEKYADDNPDLALLIAHVWQYNLLGINNKNELAKERFRIKKRFPKAFIIRENLPELEAYENPFAILSEITE